MIDLNSRRRIGTTRCMVGPLGLGTAPLGNLYESVSDTTAEATLTAAERCGITWFDVAPLYGSGLAEVRLGRHLRHSAGPPPVISTKVGRILKPIPHSQAHSHFIAPLPFRAVFDYSRDGIERSYQDSLRRLGVERVALLLLHDVDRLSHTSGHRALVKLLLDDSLPALHRLKQEGRVDAIGLGTNEWDVGYEILASADIDCVLLAGRFTLLDQTAFSSGFLDACLRRKVSVLAGGVFNSGFLAGGSHYDYTPAGESLVRTRERLTEICARHTVPLPAAALQYTASHPAITSVVVGARSPVELADILDWSQVSVPDDLWKELREAEFILDGIPTLG